jgi:lysozyme family protein
VADPVDTEIKIEGPPSDNPNDPGGPTAFGISKKANPDLWVDGPPSEVQARARYESKYIDGPKFNLIQDPHLQSQLIDWGVNSGPGVAISNLQTILGVAVDGVLGPVTLEALAKADPKAINNKLVAARVKMIGRIVSKNPSQLQFLNGWLSRSLEFQL